jgi:multidrug transporter EmrE-like cation transporter
VRRSLVVASGAIAPFAIILAYILIIHIAPVIWVLLSRRSHGGAKFGWFIVTLFFAWLGFAVFLIATQAPSDKPRT